MHSITTRCVVGYLVKGDRVLLGLRKKTEWKLGQNLISGIGGRIGDIPGLENESSDEALVREVQEEINVKVLDYHWCGEVIFLFPYKPEWNQKVQIYLINKWQGYPSETAVIKPVWYSKDNLPFQQMWDDSQYYIPLIVEGRSVKAVFSYGENNKIVTSKQVDIF